MYSFLRLFVRIGHGAVFVFLGFLSACDGGGNSGDSPSTSLSQTVTPVDVIAPYIGVANTAGEVIIRGSGFSVTTAINFGSTAATGFSVVSNTEIHAIYPALPAGSYPVQLQSNTSAIPFSANLTTVDPPGYASASLTYSSVPSEIRGLVYDAQRQALLVGLGYSTASSNQILRYAFSNGSWQPPTSAAVPNLRGFALTTDGAQLLAAADTSLTQLDAVTLSTITTTAKPSQAGTFTPDWEYLNNIVMTNDGNALITTGYSQGSSWSNVYAYSLRDSKFRSPSMNGPYVSFYRPSAGVSANGALTVIIQGLISPPLPLYQYTASSSTLSAASVDLNQDMYYPIDPALDRAGTRVILKRCSDRKYMTAILRCSDRCQEPPLHISLNQMPLARTRLTPVTFTLSI